MAADGGAPTAAVAVSEIAELTPRERALGGPSLSGRRPPWLRAQLPGGPGTLTCAG